MTFGGQSVTVVTVTRSNTPGYLGIAAESRSETVVSGCRFRAVSSKEVTDGAVDTTSEVWKCTAPPSSTVLNVVAGDEILHDGVRFQVDGPILPKYDMDGDVEHVTIMCKRYRPDNVDESS